MSDPAVPRRDILLVTTAYGVDGKTAPLANELTAALAAEGHKVAVAAIDWTAAPGATARHLTEPSGVELLLLAPAGSSRFGRRAALLHKWLGSSLALRRAMARAWPRRRFDLVIAVSPAVAVWAAIRWAMRRSRRSLLYITDFFPDHHFSLGLIPRPALGWARRFESALIRRFDIVACMSPRGVDYLRAHYPLRREQTVTVLPLWGDTTPVPAIDRAALRRRYDLPADRIIILFGGQITAGRGIEAILAAAAAARAAHPELLFLFLGSGSLEHLVGQARAAGGVNVARIAAVPRADYLALASACDIGLVATVPGVSVPTFPSKTIDYLRAGLPVVAAVEESTDYGAFVEAHGFGRAVLAGDPQRLLAAIVAVAGSPAGRDVMRKAGAATLAQVFDVRHAAHAVLAAIDSESQDASTALGQPPDP